MTRYKLPECSKERIVIDNYDLYKNGGYFLYLQENQMTIKTVDGNVQKMVQKI
jgi:hypothetical protein